MPCIVGMPCHVCMEMRADLVAETRRYPEVASYAVKGFTHELSISSYARTDRSHEVTTRPGEERSYRHGLKLALAG